MRAQQHVKAGSRRLKALLGGKELDVQHAVLAHLESRAEPGVVWFHVPNGEYRPAVTAKRLKSMGVKAGIPDLVLVADGVPMFLELKRAGRRPGKAQDTMHAALMCAGARVATAAGVDDAIAVLERWGVLRGRSGREGHGR